MFVFEDLWFAFGSYRYSLGAILNVRECWSRVLVLNVLRNVTLLTANDSACISVESFVIGRLSQD